MLAIVLECAYQLPGHNTKILVPYLDCLQQDFLDFVIKVEWCPSKVCLYSGCDIGDGIFLTMPVSEYSNIDRAEYYGIEFCELHNRNEVWEYHIAESWYGCSL